ncbi:MAG: BatD family protein [Rikenellaceae bacterium]
MKRLLLRIIFTVAAIGIIISSFAATDVTFKANAPLLVTVGEPFPVEFSLNAHPDDDSFQAPSFDGFNVIAGPRISSGQSVQVINNDITRTVNYTYTYVLIAQDAGNYTLPAATVVVDKSQYSTQPIAVEAVNESSSLSGGAQQSQQPQQSRAANPQSSASNRIANDDVMLRLIISDKSVYKGEPIRATIKLYTRVDIVNNENLKMPTFNGFWAQDVTDTRNQGARRETYNDKVYDTHVIREYLLYPQQSGDLVIEPAQIDIVAQVVVQSRNIDPFFGRGRDFYNVNRHLETPPTTIDVKKLPSGSPASFSGAVGKYSIEMIPMTSTTFEANSAVTLKLRVAGTGNLSFIQAPKLELPNSFEQYNVKTTESIRNSSGGATGYKEFEYPFIARAEGNYTIPAIEFSYFDPSTNAYTVLNTNPFSVTITPDSAAGSGAATIERGVSKVDIALLGSDIRFIKLRSAVFAPIRDPLILSWLYFAIVAAVVLIYVVLFFVLRRKIRDSKNDALRRGKRANKIAVQRFKVAKRAMDDNNERLFYEEMLRGLWGYMSDKLNIPVADLTKECVRDELVKRGGDLSVAQEFSAIITRCDEAQYSPMASSQMIDVYGCGLQLLSQIETLFKRK